MTSRHVAIVGGGFSGSLLALHLLADADGPAVTLVERSGTFGLGAAYATRNPEHLLNTRAYNMSAFPDRPDHFLNWLKGRPDGQAVERMNFVGRTIYGDYIQALLSEASQKGRAAGRFAAVVDDAVSLARTGAGLSVGFAGGRAIEADAVALALGNLPPAPPPIADKSVLASDRYIPEAWRIDLAQRVGPDDPVFILGTGLTMIDVVVALGAAGHRGPVFALSRRGLVPRAHIDSPPPKLPPLPLKSSLSRSLRTIRDLSDDYDWRLVFDGLRPVTAALWAVMTPDARRRFLRHARPYWDVHRHRLAPRVAERVDSLRRTGQLKVSAGRLVDIRENGQGFEIVWRPRGENAIETFAAGWVVNCIGPHSNIEQAGEPVLDSILAEGLARPDPLRLGLEIDAESRLVDADGRVGGDFVAVGPLTRSAFWESTAIPDIRVQVAGVAARLAAHLKASTAGEPAIRRRADL